MNSAVMLAAGDSFSYFAVGTLQVILVGAALTPEMCRAGLVGSERMAERMGGRRHAVLVDYHGGIVIPSLEVRREVVATALGTKHLPIGARAFVIRGQGIAVQAVRAFFRATTSLGRGWDLADTYADDVAGALRFLGEHIDGVPTFGELRPALRAEYARLGLVVAP